MAVVASSTTTTTMAHLPGRSTYSSNHTAGIYADMTVDGPEIGTLVVVVDRAKNLPNLRTMGKQDPYCAARLAKEAKKTDTDKRGGQTPRWDQELRFVVRDSPDYEKLKVSVFNDDKKTDLIGEAWVHLNHILRPGGGQADDWHRLSIKERYAGEIRMELTYYDSRPKLDKPRSRNQSIASSTQNDQRPFVPHVAEHVPRKPLPADPTASVARLHMHPEVPSNPLPPMPHGHQASLRQYPQQTLHHNSQALAGHPDPYFRPLPIPYEQHSSPIEAHGQIPATDDPYALETVEQRFEQMPEYQNRQQPRSIRHNRDQTLPALTNSKPQAFCGPPNVHSPSLAEPGDLLPEYSSNSDPGYGDYIPNRAYPDSTWNNIQPENVYYSQHLASTTIRNQAQHWQMPQATQRDAPPPPPVHRHSLPSVPTPFARASPNRETPPSCIPPRTNVLAQETSDPRHPEQTSSSPSDAFQYHLSRSADSSLRPRNELACDPRMRYNQDAGSMPNASMHIDPEPPAYTNTKGDIPGARPEPPKLCKPIPVRAPRDQTSNHQTPRKSVNPKLASAESQLSTPYSPDSFDAFNPNHSDHSTPDNGPLNKKAPIPMYLSKSSPQSQGTSPISPDSPKAPPIPSTQAGPSNLPIIGSDGRVKDPTDHLPPSSYAPEPERNQNRPTSATNVKARFGPREANPTGTSTVSNTLPSRQYQRPARDINLPSSPLSPAQSNTLNMNGGSYNLSSPYPPPVPGKIPLGGYQSQVDEPNHFEMAALSMEDDPNMLAESRSTNVKTSNIFGWGKARKSRWTP